ncbi:MAG: type I-U CRISPR-associated protein Csb2 [Firmicutes bacterium]|nr:type I-U CRISPR-associated protein Csb2 [Bacillota bacterium]
MVIIAFNFLAGQYHATPWGRHVNEGDVEWPPSPWRMLRSLLGVWHRKGGYEAFSPETMDRLVERLASELPLYHTPSAAPMHTRHYMPMREGRADHSRLIFDAGLSVKRDTPLVVMWPHTELGNEETHLLDYLLERMTYLGRAESWVEAQRLTRWDAAPNCVPALEGALRSPASDEQSVRLLAPLNLDDYRDWRAAWIAQVDTASQGNRGRRRRNVTRVPPPESLVDALLLETADLARGGWSQPPGSRWVQYRFTKPAALLASTAESRARSRRLTTARLVLAGKPLPLVSEAVVVGELMRLAMMAQASRIAGTIPAILSGRDADGRVRNDGHRHAFFLPEDADDDGFLDHVVIFAAEGLDEITIRALDRLDRIYTVDGMREWPVVLEGIGQPPLFAPDSRLVGSARVWQSVTPYLHPWHRKRNGRFGPAEQLRRELISRGYQEPCEIRPLPHIMVGGRLVSPLRFRRFRSRGSQSQPDRSGSFWRIAFADPIEGPLSLGYGCHYGLGVFEPTEED